jgi:hypothetical protein
MEQEAFVIPILLQVEEEEQNLRVEIAHLGIGHDLAGGRGA